MQKLNPFKIYSLALFHLFLPKSIRHNFHFKVSPVEHLAIGTTMTKIKYWKHFIRKDKSKMRKTFNKKDETYYFKRS